LLNLLGLIDRPDAGELILEGQDLTQAPESRLTELRKERIGFIFQDFFLVPVMSAFENVEYPLLLLGHPARKRHERVEKYLTRVGLWERRHHKPRQLSGGEQQRVAIARALVKEPDLVIADEPTANLDSKTTHEITRILHDLSQEENTTFVVSSHDPIVIESCQQVLPMRDGRLEAVVLLGGE
jgi:putative ABC transport system ATP-binding protein